MTSEDREALDRRLRSAARYDDGGVDVLDVDAEWQRLERSLDDGVRPVVAVRRGWVAPTAAAAAALALVVAGTSIALTRTVTRGGPSTPAATVGRQSTPNPVPLTPVPSTTGPTLGTAVCTLPPGPDGVAWPTDVRWQRVDGVQTPSSETYGPQRADKDSPATCFAHSRLGAVFSALHLSVDSARTDVRTRLTGPGTSLLATSSPEAPITPVAFVGYQVTMYTGAEAVVSIAVRGPGGVVATTSITQVWDANRHDWLTYVDGSGRIIVSADYPDALVGYTLIPGQPPTR